MAAVARSVRSAQGWSRRGSLTRAECASVVLSTARRARPWRVRPGDGPAGDAARPPTPTQSAPGERSTRLNAFPELRPSCGAAPSAPTFLVLVAACPGGYDAASYANHAIPICGTRHRFSQPAHMRLDISLRLVQMSSRACCGGFAVVVESASHWGEDDTGPALGGVPVLFAVRALLRAGREEASKRE
jgi:hypothetical protein